MGKLNDFISSVSSQLRAADESGYQVSGKSALKLVYPMLVIAIIALVAQIARMIIL